MTTIPVKDANGTTQNIEAPIAPGRAAATGSRPVALSNEDSASLGALTETAPATDTASSGLNGRLQRISQRVTALIALLPTALGAGGGLKVDGSGTALPVSAASLPLPTGAATAAKQPALGTAGSASTDVLTVQGIASGTPQPVSIAAGDAAIIGSLTETAPGTDTASSGLNGRLQRIAQRITSLIALYPTNWSTVAVKAASTAPAATDPAMVVAISPNSVNANGQATMAGSAPVVIASNQSAVPVAATGSVSTIPTASANGATASRINAAATTNATSLKTSAGNLVAIDVFNVAAYDVFLKFYNKASAPTVGTDTPVWTIPIKAGTGYSARFPVGKSFATGIAYAITKLQADSDTTVVAAGDVTGSTDWI